MQEKRQNRRENQQVKAIREEMEATLKNNEQSANAIVNQIRQESNAVISQQAKMIRFRNILSGVLAGVIAILLTLLSTSVAINIITAMANIGALK